jgi:hypothetical protein
MALFNSWTSFSYDDYFLEEQRGSGGHTLAISSLLTADYRDRGVPCCPSNVAPFMDLWAFMDDFD